MRWSLAVGSLVLALESFGRANAGTGGECRIVDLDFVPATDPGNPLSPQIVAWLEDASGAFVDTIYITQATGTFGLGNRPGRFDFNSGPLWPYGRRVTTFPVWSTRQPLRWPTVTFRDGQDDNLSHAVAESSQELHFCRPITPAEFDATTCPTQGVRTDKGTLDTAEDSRYPPRDDITVVPPFDDPSAAMFAMLNPFDAISRPSPLTGVSTQLSVALPPALPSGDYVLWLEVSKEFDMNGTYNETVYPSPVVLFGDYGKPYRGQPSVLYRVPIALSTESTTATTIDYAGYGDPDGLDGDIRAPDATISTGVPGSGADRLALISANGTMYRVRAVARHELDDIAPDHPHRLHADLVTANSATLTFIAPGDDYQTGNVAGYEVRYRVGDPVTEDNFDTSTVVITSVAIAPPRTEQTIIVEGLLPQTTYSIGIRAFDNCRNQSSLTTLELTTPDRTSSAVDACFVATAAYGSPLANDVERLRGFRDRVLSKSVVGELAVETYYTFGPVLAHLIGQSELLRATARGVLAPIVDGVP